MGIHFVAEAGCFLARISHQPPGTSADLPGSTSLRSLGVLDGPASPPPHASVATPCMSGHLRRLVTDAGEKCGLRLPADELPDRLGPFRQPLGVDQPPSLESVEAEDPLVPAQGDEAGLRLVDDSIQPKRRIGQWAIDACL